MAAVPWGTVDFYVNATPHRLRIANAEEMLNACHAMLFGNIQTHLRH